MSNNQAQTSFKTGWFTHPDCQLHEMGPGHPECPERLTAIAQRMADSGLQALVEQRLVEPADPNDMALGHSAHLIERLQDCDQLLAEQAGSGVRARYTQIDPDTAMNRSTWSAVRHSVGAVLNAIDAVMAGELVNAFCAVRPPGHHATRDHSMGFCLINQVAVAANYALERHGLSRVAIVDFDVHHGNGTEDIVAGDPRILMVSFYQHPFYPHGGSRSPANNLLNVPVPAGTRGDVIRRVVQDQWLPRLHAHRPELVLISAGFDAHQDDDLGQMGLVEADYAWMTQRLMDVADRYAQGRVVSSLEGGYNLQALARSVEAHVRTLAGA
jgi:acetoin utilization deacetylase AcuC-like enzyme